MTRRRGLFVLFSMSILPPIALPHANPLDSTMSRYLDEQLSMSTISWSDFLDIKPAPHYSANESRVNLGHLRLCSQDTVNKITSKLSTADLKWCQWALDSKGGGVKLGESYGKLKSNEIEKFEFLNCNNIARGLDLSCDDMMGSGLIQSWKRNLVTGLCEKNANSKIHCYDSVFASSRFCIFENVMMNFKKVRVRARGDGTGSMGRIWEKGFLSADCGETARDDIGYTPLYKPDIEGSMDAICDYVFNETVIAYSHENIRNFGHSMLADMMNVWSLLWLSSNTRNSKEISLLNIDGMFKSSYYGQDLPNQFFRHYEMSFRRILRAAQFSAKVDDPTVCFKTLIMQPKPPIPYSKDGWLKDTRCSMLGPSALFQRWNLQIRKAYGLLDPSNIRFNSSLHSNTLSQSHLQKQLPRHDVKVVSSEKKNKDANPIRNFNSDWKILLLTRSFRKNITSSRVIDKDLPRTFANQKDIINAFKSYAKSKSIDFMSQDLNKISFESQVRLIGNASIIVGMHGAGIASTVHMAVGTPNCCGVIEIFPPGEFMPIRGYGNMARRMGHHYHRIELTVADNTILEISSKGNTVSSASSGSGGGSTKMNVRGGSIVMPSVLIDAVEAQIKAISTKPSCFLPSVIRSPV